MYATQLDNCQRFGEDVDETSLNVATTLHNIAIVHVLLKNFEDAIQLFERALKIRKDNNGDEADVDYYVRKAFLLIFMHLFCV